MSQESQQIKADREKKPRSTQQVERLYALHKLWLSTAQRIICTMLAAWTLIQTHSIWQFLIILAAGFIDIQWAKKILTGIAKAGSLEE